jgi:hypothetical protein
VVAAEGLLKASLERLFQTLRGKRASKEARVRGILEFHFTNQSAVRCFLGDMGMIEEWIELSPYGAEVTEFDD